MSPVLPARTERYVRAGNQPFLVPHGGKLPRQKVSHTPKENKSEDLIAHPKEILSESPGSFKSKKTGAKAPARQYFYDKVRSQRTSFKSENALSNIGEERSASRLRNSFSL